MNRVLTDNTQHAQDKQVMHVLWLTTRIHSFFHHCCILLQVLSSLRCYKSMLQAADCPQQLLFRWARVLQTASASDMAQNSSPEQETEICVPLI